VISDQEVARATCGLAVEFTFRPRPNYALSPERIAELSRLFQDERESTGFDTLIKELGMLLEHSGRVERAREK
jgi:hypothetical protein